MVSGLASIFSAGGVQVRGNRILLTICPAAIALAGCSPATHDKPAPAMTAKEIVGFCSPFTAANSDRMLEFSLPGSVELTERAPFPGAGDQDILAAKHVRVSRGTFVIEPATMKVTVDVAGTQTTYVAYSPPGMDQCVLVHGTPAAADLTDSWFGDLPTSDNAEDSDPE
jgi:hypothetical protein